MTIDGLIIRAARLFGKDRLLPLVENAAAQSRRRAAFWHRQQFNIQWNLPPTPEWYDHFLDLYWHWPTHGVALGQERGCFSLLAIPQGAAVLSLCCGDGFNERFFYANRASSLVAVDFDVAAIAHARTFHQVVNVEFRVADIRHAMPEGFFDNIIWDAAIEHFTPDEIAAVLKAIYRRLNAEGVLSGYTIVERSGGKQLVHHEYEFRSKEDLLRFLAPHFANVRVFETVYPTRHNLYFYASDGPVPFDDKWDRQTVAHSTGESQ